MSVFLEQFPGVAFRVNLAVSIYCLQGKVVDLSESELAGLVLVTTSHCTHGTWPSPDSKKTNRLGDAHVVTEEKR